MGRVGPGAEQGALREGRSGVQRALHVPAQLLRGAGGDQVQSVAQILVVAACENPAAAQRPLGGVQRLLVRLLVVRRPGFPLDLLRAQVGRMVSIALGGALGPRGGALSGIPIPAVVR